MAKPQIFNRDMKRLAYLDNALAVGYGLETNSLWTATFTLPADDPKNAYCTPLNFVEIFDGDRAYRPFPHHRGGYGAEQRSDSLL